MFGRVVVLVALTGVFSYFFFRPIYNYFRDEKKLRRFPNMTPLAGVTNLSFMILSRQGFRSKKLHELHAQGKPIIRTGPNALSFSDVRAIKDIYGHNTKCIKDGQYSVTAGSHFHLADVVDKHEHARKRKVLSSAYALKNLEEWEHKVADKTQRIIRQFDRICQRDQPAVVDYRKWTNFFTLDAIADIGLSERLGFLDQGHDRCTGERLDGSTYEANFRECLYANSHAVSELVWSYDWYKVIAKLSRFLSPTYYRRLWTLSDRWDGIVLRRASERWRRYEKGEKLDDFFDALLHDKKTGNVQNLEWGEIVAEVSIMMNAGSTTTAIAMANVLFQVLKHPEVLNRLREEIDSVLDEDDDIVAPFEKVKHLPYLRACLDESLRLYPPTSHGLPRETPLEGASIMGEWIPGGTTVSMSSYVVHRDPTIFPEPECFRPERFLGDAGKELQPYFLAFSAGARGCIGRNISYLEQTVLLASMLHRYEFELLDPTWEPRRRETLNLHLDELPVRIRRRRRSMG